MQLGMAGMVFNYLMKKRFGLLNRSFNIELLARQPLARDCQVAVQRLVVQQPLEAIR